LLLVNIGLNDLHIEMKMDFMFELLAKNIIDDTIYQIRKEKKDNYGFGGIARLGEGKVDSKIIIAEHIRLGSSMAILSRSFCDMKYENDYNKISDLFTKEVLRIRNFENEISNRGEEFFKENREKLKILVEKVVGSEE